MIIFFVSRDILLLLFFLSLCFFLLWVLFGDILRHTIVLHIAILFFFLFFFFNSQLP